MSHFQNVIHEYLISIFTPKSKIQNLKSYLPYALYPLRYAIFVLLFALCALPLPAAIAAQVTIAWDKNSESDIAGYRMHYGTTSGSYAYNADVGNYTSCTISGLQEGETYYFAATAYNTNNIESKLSEEIVHTIPVKDSGGGGIPNEDEINIYGTDVEGFEAYATGENPMDWLDTAAKNSMKEDDSLFKIFDLGGEKAFGTTSTRTNIHSHYFGTDTVTDSGYEYTGRMMMTASTGGIGVTFFSQYPDKDAYYRLRRYSNKSFHIAPHPDGTIISGDTDTGVVPAPNKWYRFRVQVEDTGGRTDIRAKVWPDGTSEPVAWQVNAYDDSATRLTEGTIGVWSYSSGSKYWDDLAVGPVSPAR